MQSFTQNTNLASQVLVGHAQGTGPYGYIVGGSVRVNTPGLLAVLLVIFDWDEGGVTRSASASVSLASAGLFQIPPVSVALDTGSAAAYVRVSAILVGTANYTVNCITAQG